MLLANVALNELRVQLQRLRPMFWQLSWRAFQVIMSRDPFVIR